MKVIKINKKSYMLKKKNKILKILIENDEATNILESKDIDVENIDNFVNLINLATRRLQTLFET